MRSLFRLCCLPFLFLSAMAFGQNSKVDSLLNVLAGEKSGMVRLELLKTISSQVSQTDLQKANIYNKQGIALAEKIPAKDWIPVFTEMAGRNFANMLQLDSAALFFERALGGYRDVDNKRGQATTLFKIAWVAKRKGDIESALKHDLGALKLMEELDDKAGICDAYTRISSDLTRQKRLKEAMDYAEKAIAISEANNLEGEMYYVQTNAGDVYMAGGEFQKSYENYKAAENTAIAQDLGAMSMSDVTNNVGNALKRLERYPEALKEYERAYAFARSVNYQNAFATCLANLGEVNLILGNYKAALAYQLETIKLMEKNQEGSHLVENYHHIASTYEKLHDFATALAYQKKAFHVRDSLGSLESDAAMSKMLTQYETEKKEATIASQEAQLLQQQRVQWLGYGIVTLLIGFIAFGIVSYRSRTRTNRLLSMKNADNELLLKEIHHRVKNNLEVVSSLLALQSAQISDVNTKEAMLEGQNRVNSIGIVHQKLYQGENLGAIEMKDYFFNLSESILDTFGAEDRVKLELAMEKLDVDIDTAVPLGLIVNELLTNTLKYAFPAGQDGKVSIKLEKHTNGNLHLEVSDNGTGKTGTTKGTGFGSQLVMLLTKQLNGIMREENVNGTRVIFDFKG